MSIFADEFSSETKSFILKVKKRCISYVLFLFFAVKLLGYKMLHNLSLPDQFLNDPIWEVTKRNTMIRVWRPSVEMGF